MKRSLTSMQLFERFNSFCRMVRERDTNQDLRHNLGGNWNALDTISSIALPSQSSYMRVLETTNDELEAAGSFYSSTLTIM
jgi:hypothetical protein